MLNEMSPIFEVLIFSVPMTDALIPRFKERSSFVLLVVHFVTNV